MDFRKLEDFLKEIQIIYSKLPVKEKTFMEVSGYPHYENVCSNILSFYLNPKEEHKLDDIVLKSLIETIKLKTNFIDVNTSNFDVFREYTTQKGNRIDIVLKNDEVVIGIENKIKASVYNDLEDYANTLNVLNKDSIKILLSLYNNEKVTENTEFINIKYHELFNQLKVELDNVKYKDNKWYIFLVEFINNIENFEGELEMEEEIINWLNANQNEINELDKIREIATKSIEKKQEELKVLLEEKLKVNYIKIWKGNSDMSCYIDAPLKYHVDAKLNPSGWKVGIFTWTVSNHNRIKQIIDNSNYTLIEDETNHRWLYRYDYNTDIEEILNKVIEIYSYVENQFKLVK